MVTLLFPVKKGISVVSTCRGKGLKTLPSEEGFFPSLFLNDKNEAPCKQEDIITVKGLHFLDDLSR